MMALVPAPASRAFARGVLTVEALRSRCTVDPVSHCWHWTGAISSDGIPRIHTFDHAVGDKRVLTGPRAAWNIAHGEAPPADRMVFRCCGERLCLNPAHLRLAATKAEIGLHWRRAGFRLGTALDARRANAAKAQAARGITPTDSAVVLAIRQAPAEASNVELAQRFGVAHQTVSRIRRGQSHRHLLPTQPQPEAA